MAATQPSQAEMERDRAEAQQMRSLRTPQRLDLIAGKMARDQAGFRAQADAVKRFYAALSPDQQRAFDQVTAPPPEDQQGGQDGPPEGYGQPPRR